MHQKVVDFVQCHSDTNRLIIALLSKSGYSFLEIGTYLMFGDASIADQITVYIVVQVFTGVGGDVVQVFAGVGGDVVQVFTGVGGDVC